MPSTYYNSQYYTCEEIDERLLKGYYDDVVSKGYPLTFDQFKSELASVNLLDVNIKNNNAGYTLATAIVAAKSIISSIPVGLRIRFTDSNYGKLRTIECTVASAPNNLTSWKDITDYKITLAELNGTSLNGLWSELATLGCKDMLVYNSNTVVGILQLMSDTSNKVVNQILITSCIKSNNSMEILSTTDIPNINRYERIFALASTVDIEGNTISASNYSKWYEDPMIGRLSGVEEEIEALKKFSQLWHWTVGLYPNVDEFRVDTSRKYRACLSGIVNIQSPTTITANSGYTFGVRFYDHNGIKIADSVWKKSYTIPEGSFVGIMVRHVDTTSGSDDTSYVFTVEEIDDAITIEYADVSALDERLTEVEESTGHYVSSADWIYVITDHEQRVVAGIKKDGSVEWFAGVPKPIKEYIESFEGFVHAEDGKSLIDEDVADGTDYIEDGTYIYSITDHDGHVIIDIRKNGSVVFGAGVPLQIKDYIESMQIDIPDEITEAIDDLKGGKQQSSDILYLNPEEKVLPVLQNMKRKSMTAASNNVTVLSFIHCSDVHAQNENILRIKRFKDYYSSFIDFVLDTGDFIGGQITDGLPSATSEVSDFIRVVGNHDTSIRVGVVPNHHWEYVSGLECYNTFLRGYIENWGVVQPANASLQGKCYYYKDFSANKVRLICLDPEHSPATDAVFEGDWNTQVEWLQSVLTDARTYELHVVIALHRLPFLVNQIQGCTFTSVDYPNGRANYSAVVGNQLRNIVKDFIDAGGSFVCYFCGHLHQDTLGVGMVDANSNQLVVSVGTASSTGSSNPKEIEVDRVLGTKTQDLFNVVGIDTSAKTLKIFRIGAEYDRTLRHRSVMAWNYGTSELIYNY